MGIYGIFITVPTLILSLVFISSSMEPVSQPALLVGVSKTRQRVDKFVEALKGMEVTDDKALLNYRHEFFTIYSRELIAEPHGKALGDDCVKFLDEAITKYCGKDETSFHEFYTLCVFVAVMLSKDTKEKGIDTILDNSRMFVKTKELNKEKLGTPEFFGAFLNYLFYDIYRPENHQGIAFITMGTQNKFYPLILIHNQFYQPEHYFYALGNRVYLLSQPHQPCKGLHNDYYTEPIEVLNHDIGHFTHYSENNSGTPPFIFSEPLGSNIGYKYDIYQRVGQYFFDLLQRQNIDEISRKKIKEIGLNLTHENKSHSDVKFPCDSCIKSDFSYLMRCLRINLKEDFLPDCLQNVDAFEKSLANSYIQFLKLLKPNEVPGKMQTSRVKIKKTGPLPLSTFEVSYEGNITTHTSDPVCYEHHKRKRVDWAKSAQRAGYKGKFSEDGMKYNVVGVRKFHLDLLAWFEKSPYYPK